MKQSIKIVSINEGEKQRLEYIIPNKLWDIYDETETITLGIKAEEDLFLGAAVFRENAHYMELLWIYVEPEFRRMGFATALIVRMMSVVETSEYFVGMYADYESKNQTELDALLSAMGFERKKQEWPAYSFRLSDMLRLHELVKKNQDIQRMSGLSRISECTDTMKKQYSNKLYQNEEVNLIELPIDWGNYDDDLSCVYSKGREIEGVFLLETDEQRINVAFAYAKNNPYVFSYMLIYSFMKAQEKYKGADSEVTVTVFEDITEKLLKKLVPDVKGMFMTHAQKTIQRA